MKKMLLGILLLTLAVCLCACGSTQPAEPAPAEPAATEPVEAVVDNTAPAAKYDVELLDAQKLTSYDGEELLVVFYNFTNNSEDTTSATIALHFKAFQDGVQLDSGYLSEDGLPADKAATYDADWKDIRPGTTIQCYAAFVPASTSDIEVEVTELISFDNTILASKVYSVQ